MGGNALIGRDAELTACDTFLAAVDEGPRMLVVEGEPGIGKTRVWVACVESAHDLGYRVLSASPSQSETTLAFAGLSDLIGLAGDSVLEGLPRPQRRALEVALLRRTDAEPPDRRAVGAAVLGVLDRLTADGPVVVAVDDLQWLDTPSFLALDFAARRLSARRVGVLVAIRAGHGSALVERPPANVDVKRLLLEPLTVAGLFRLVRDRIGLEIPRPSLVRLHEACGGNPLFAMEIARELREGRIHLSPGEPVPLPNSLLGLVEMRTQRLPASTRNVLVAAAALARPSTVILEAALGRERVERGLELASRAGVVEVSRESVRFEHPLFASAAYTSAPAHVRRAVHRSLGGAIADPEERARHLALGAVRRDETTAAAAALAADHAAARGAPATAAELAELAVELTPRATTQQRQRRILRALELHAAAGGLERARVLGRELLGELPPGSLRAESALALSGTLEHDLDGMTELIERALEEPGLEAPLQARLFAQLSEALYRRGHAREALEPARAGLELAREAGDTRIELVLVAQLMTAEFWSGEPDVRPRSSEAVPAILREAVALEEETGIALPFTHSPRAVLATRLTHLGEHEPARDLFAQVIRGASANGDERTHAGALRQLAQLEDYAGNWQRTSELIDRACELEEQLGVESGALAFSRAGRAATLGLVEETEALARAGAEQARIAGDAPYELLNRGVLGFLRLSLGDAAGAAEILCPVVEQAMDLSEPRINRYWPDTVEALAAAGDLERARDYLSLYTAEADRLGVPRSLARAAHCRGVLAAAEGDAEAAFAAFAEALEIDDRVPNVFERGRTLLALGIARRRFKQRRLAREAIKQALGIFEGLPAPLWVDRSHDALARLGTRATTSELTETERQVAELAASGLRNREIAAQAFLTPKSVEDVLGRVYRKLGIHSRAELGAWAASNDGR